MIKQIILSLCLLVLMAGTASAGWAYYPTTDIIQSTTGSNIALEDLVTTINNPAAIYKSGNTIYVLATIRPDGSVLTIDGDGYTTVDFGSSSTGGSIYNTGSCNIHGVELKGGKGISLGGGSYLYDVTMTNVGPVTIYNSVTGRTFENITSVGRGIKFIGGHDFSISEIDVTNTADFGLWVTAVSPTTAYNIDISDIYVYDPDNHLVPTVGKYGVTIGEGSTAAVYNIDISDMYIYGSGWGGFGITMQARDITWRDIYIENAGHNAYDVHASCPRIYGQNMTIVNPVSNGFFFTHNDGPGVYDNITVIGADTAAYDGIVVSNMLGYNAVTVDASNILITNLTVEGATKRGYGIKIGSSEGYVRSNVTVIGATIDKVDTGTQIYSQGGAGNGEAHDIRLIDFGVTNCNYGSAVWEYTGGEVYDTHLINYQTATSMNYAYPGGEYTVYWPANISVANYTSVPVEGAIITVSSTVPALDADGNTFVSATTDSSGRIPASDRVYVPDFKRTGTSTYTNYVFDASAVKSGWEHERYDFNPTESWYSPLAYQGSYAGANILLSLNVDGAEGEDPIPDSEWVLRNTPADNNWTSIAYGDGTFVAVAYTGTGNRIMSSTDGITWTQRSNPEDNSWVHVHYGNGLFVATAFSGTNRIMTSPDGITWTPRSAPYAHSWMTGTYGNGRHVGLAISVAGMYSDNGASWTATTIPNQEWRGAAYGNGVFVAVSSTGTDRVITSPDGITWTARSTPGDALAWRGVAFGDGTFVAVSDTLGTQQVMTSTNGIDWTLRTTPTDQREWKSVAYGGDKFVAVASGGGSGKRIMTSLDNGVTWTSSDAPAEQEWRGVAYGNGMFAAVSTTGTGTRVMTGMPLPEQDALAFLTTSPAASAQGVAPGDSITFSVSTNYAADFEWFVDGVSDSTTSGSFISSNTVTKNAEDDYNITVVAEYDTETISKTWTLTVITTGYQDNQFAGGAGTVSDPWWIADVYDLQYIGNDTTTLAGHYIQIMDIDAGVTSTWNSGSGFAPIGSSTTRFTGSYNGDGYDIDDLHISRPSTSYVGVFSHIGSTGRVTDMHLTDADISGGISTGGIAGRAFGDIADCTFDGTLISSSSYAAGIAGQAFSNEISRCGSSGSIRGTSGVSGIVAYTDSADVTDCMSTAAITASTAYGAGIVAFSYTDSNIENCISTGLITTPTGKGGVVYSASAETSVVRSYYDSITTTCSDTGKGVGLPTASLQSESTFTGWDFYNTWRMQGYPVLAYYVDEDFYIYPGTQTINVVTPPLLHPITIEAFYPGAASYDVRIAADPTYTTLIYNDNILSAGVLADFTKDLQLAAQTYYLTVDAKDAAGSIIATESSTFTLSQTVELGSTSVAGSVYEIISGVYTPISNAKVTIYNDTYSMDYITYTYGYYQFVNLSSNTTYYISVAKNGYESSNANIVTTVADTTYTKNLFMQKESAPNYITPHYVEFVVKSFTQKYDDVLVTVYSGGSATPMYIGYTGSDGAAGFELSETFRYRITFYREGVIDREVKLTPTKNSYTVWVDIGELIDSMFDNSYQQINNVDIDVTTTEINSTHAYITVSYLDEMDETTNLTFALMRPISHQPGNYTIIASTSPGDVDEAEYNFTVSDYSGGSYIVSVEAQHGTFGAIDRQYGVTFEGQASAFGFAVEILIWFVVVLIVWFASTASQADVFQTGFALCGLTIVMKLIGITGSFISWPGIALALVICLVGVLYEAEKEAV